MATELAESANMSFEILTTLGILTTTILLFLFEIIRVDVVAVIVLVALGITKILPQEILFSGFSSEAVISLISVMIISRGLENAGIVNIIANQVIKLNKESKNTTWLFLTASSGLMAGFMRSAGTMALYLPIVNKIIKRSDYTKAELLLPISFCTIVGGTLTMVGTGPLIILNSLLNTGSSPGEHQLAEFSLFYVFPIGMCLLSACILYWYFLGFRLLPKKSLNPFQIPTAKEYFEKTYSKGGELFELKILNDSPLINISIREVESHLPLSASLVAYKTKELNFPPLRRTIVEANANIAIMSNQRDIEHFAEKFNLKLKNKLSTFSDLLHITKAGIAEAVIPPSSSLIGSKVNELHMKRNYNVQVLALYRNDAVYQGERLKNLFLNSGDTLAIFTSWDILSEFDRNPDFVVITTNYPQESKPNYKKMPHAIFFTILAVILIIFGNFAMPIGFLLGAIGMVSTGVISIDKAYESVSWRTVFLLGGLIPLGIAMDSTGTAEWLVNYSGVLNAESSILVKQISLAILTTMMALVISNIGATVVLVPIAINIAEQAGANPSLFALTIALSASNTFLLPTHQATSIIMGPGGYNTKDFFKTGAILTIINWFIIIFFLHH